MSDDTLEVIMSLTDERLQLYLLAGHQRLMPDQSARVDEITARLADLWDQYRRELAANGSESKERVLTQAKYDTNDVRRAIVDEDEQAA